MGARIFLRQAAGGELRNVNQLRRYCAGRRDGDKRIAEHGVAEGAGGGDGVRTGRGKFASAVVRDAFARFFTEKGKSAACSAAEAALLMARRFNQCCVLRDNSAGLVIHVAIAAEIAGVVEDDFVVFESVDLGG